MGLFGKARKWVKAIGPAELAEPQPFRITCPSGHVIRGRRTEGYQALRCPDCGEGVFVLPRSPLPMPPMPAARADEPTMGAGGGYEEAPIPLADHVYEGTPDESEIEWLEPVDPGVDLPEEAPPHYDPVEAAVSDLPQDVEQAPSPPRRPRANRPAAAPGPDRERSSPPGHRPQRARSAPPAGPRILVAARPTIGQRLRRNQPMLIGLTVVGVLVGTVAFAVYRNQRRDYPAMVQQGREQGIPALDEGDFDRAHRILSRAAEAVGALRGQIGGAEEIRQAAREAAIFVDLIPDRLETILDQRARAGDEKDWASRFDRSYKGRSILISAQVTGTPETSGRFEVNYRVLNDTARAPRQARIDFDGFRLFELAAPRVGTQIQFGARLEAIESEDIDGWRIRLQPASGVTITHVEALEALGWRPVETAKADDPGGFALPAHPLALLTSLLTPPMAQDLKGETRERVLAQLGAPRSYARSASQGESIEQWVYDGPSGTRQYINFVRSTGRSGPAVVEHQFFLR